MFASKAYVFVLWGDGFDEAVAAIFVTQLREVGLPVRVVGLTSRQIHGNRGLALVPDMTLDEALPLADQTSCLIIPSKSRWIEQYKYDPRIRKFLQLANANNAKFVIGKLQDSTQIDLDLPELIKNKLIAYPETEDLVDFARKIAQILSRGV
jgi:hypothetical protein